MPINPRSSNNRVLNPNARAADVAALALEQATQIQARKYDLRIDDLLFRARSLPRAKNSKELFDALMKAGGKPGFTTSTVVYDPRFQPSDQERLLSFSTATKLQYVKFLELYVFLKRSFPKCPSCTQHYAKRSRFLSSGYPDFDGSCGITCRLESSLEKREATCLANFGFRNPSQLDEVKRKKAETTLGNYGVENPLSSEIIQKRVRQTNVKRLGVKNPGESQLVQEKMRRTRFKKTGFDHHFSDPEFFHKFQKECYSFREISIRKSPNPSDKVQGYEAEVIQVFDRLPDVVLIQTSRKEIPHITYKRPNGRTSTYYPDFLVRYKNGSRLVVEVKSDYTLKSSVDNNLLKFNSAYHQLKSRGFGFVVCVIKRPGVPMRVYNRKDGWGLETPCP